MQSDATPTGASEAASKRLPRVEFAARAAARAMDYAILLGVWWFLRDFVLTWLYYRVLDRHVSWYLMTALKLSITWLLLLPGPMAIWGTTFGKQAFGLRVRRSDNGGRMSLWRALPRELLMVPTFLLPEAIGISAFSMLRENGAFRDTLYTLALAAGIAAVSWTVWTACRRRTGQFPHDRVGHSAAVRGSSVSLVWLVPVALCAVAGLGYVAWK